MSETVLGALATAALLGVTHAIEPDHVAGISSLTSQYGDSRLSALVGVCFSIGHVALVVLWLVVGYVLLDRTSFPDVFDAVGTVGVAVLLGLLGGVLVLGGLKRVAYAHSHKHEHDGEVHRHSHSHLPLLTGHEHRHATHEHEHDVREYLKTGVVGALFTLSPPLSMIAFSATLFPVHGSGIVTASVLVYAVAITATMGTLGAGVGGLFGVVGTLNERAYGGAQALTGVGVVALSVSLLSGVAPVL